MRWGRRRSVVLPRRRFRRPVRRSRCRAARTWSPSSSAAHARSTGCSAGSRARSRQGCGVWWSRTPSPPAALPRRRSSACARRGSRWPGWSRWSTGWRAAGSGSKPPPMLPIAPWSRSTRYIPSGPIGAEVEPDAVEVRVVGCLVEKQRTTPDVYPLSLNALRLACNQSTNRDPVVDYHEAAVVEAMRRLALGGWTRLASNAGSRARKYRHLLDEALGLDDGEVSLLAVLMLRGPQTPGELKQRTARLHEFEDLNRVHEALARLVEA